MEFIRGETLTDYAARRKLSTHDRLHLMVRICHAVQHAHQKGIIHRDLKPANILVTEDDARTGEGSPSMGSPSAHPKILDFGVARATDADLQTTTLQTDIGQLIGTVPYMSPEQAGGDPNELDTRSDVYALGVIAYELLAGRLPYDLQRKMIHEAVRVIREDEPTRLSSINRTLRGDVEIVVSKALEKEKERRYQSAQELASDIEFYLRDEPITARAPSSLYNAKKFARRNKALVAGVAATIVALLAGLIGTTTYAARETVQRQRAQLNEQRSLQSEQKAIAAQAEEKKRADEVEVIAEFQASQLKNIETELMGRRLQLNLIDKRRTTLRNRGLDEQAIALALRPLEESLTEVNFTNVALDTLDENIFGRALKAIDDKFADQPLIKARLLQSLADTMRELGLLERAMSPQTQALELRRRFLGNENPSTLSSTENLGLLLREQGKLEDAERYLQDALAGHRAVLGEDHPSTFISMSNLAVMLAEQGKWTEAELHYREALKGQRRVLGDKNSATLSTCSNLGILLQQHGKLDQADEFLREAFKGYAETLGNDHPTTLQSINNLARLLHQQGKLDEAESHLREAIVRFRRTLGDEHPDTLIAINNLGFLYRDQGDLDQAYRHLHEAFEGFRRLWGNNHPTTITAMNNIGGLLEAQGKVDEAEIYLRMSFEGRERTLGIDHPDTIASATNLSGLLRESGRFAEAESLEAGAVAASRRTFPPGHWRTAVALLHHGRTLAAMSRHQQAEECLVEAQQIFESTLGLQHDASSKAIKALADLYSSWHAADSDKGYDRKAEEWRAKLAVPPQSSP